MAKHHLCCLSDHVGRRYAGPLRTLPEKATRLPANFPPVDGVPLDALQGGNPFGARSRATFRAMLQRQPDPELERTRRDVRRRWLPVALWIYGFSVLVICMVFSVAVLRHVARGMRLLP